MKFNTKIFLASLFLAPLFVFGSLLIPVKIYTQEAMQEVKLGLPIPFFIKNQERFDPPFPYSARFDSPLESPFDFLFPQFVISFIIVFVLIYILILWILDKKSVNVLQK